MRARSAALTICTAAACLAAGLAAPAAGAASPAWLPLAGSGPTNLPPVQDELQRLAVDATEGTYRLSFEGEETGPIAWNAEASAVAAALNGLASIGAEGVSVSGGPGGPGAESPYFVSFDGGALADTDVPPLALAGEELQGAGGTATLTGVHDGGPGTSLIVIWVQNVGGAPSAGPTTVSFELPAGVKTTEPPDARPQNINPWACGPEEGVGQEAVSCTLVAVDRQVAQPGTTLLPLVAPVSAEAGAESGVVQIKVWGGGAAESTEGTAATYEMPLIISDIDAPPGFQSFNAGAYDEDGVVEQDAGAHPYSASAGILVNTKRAPRSGHIVPVGEFRDIVVDTPPGFIGNPIATEQCPEATEQDECPSQSVVATAQIPQQSLTSRPGASTVNNIQAPFGLPAKFRFEVASLITINVAASLRSDEDYGISAGSYETPQISAVYGSFFTFWGTPADPGHDEQRGGPAGAAVAFLTNPVDCAEEALRAPVARLNVNTWQNPGLLFTKAVALKPIEGCDELDFKVEEFAFTPGSGAADSPASFTTELELPSAGLLGKDEKGNFDPEARINPTIKQTAIELPEGVVLNASAAAGLAACSETQIGLRGTGFPRPNEIRFSKEPDRCPDAAKIGSGKLKSELIDEELDVELFLAAQGEGNPFGSLFAIYLVIENPRNGIFIKLPGEVRVDERSGRQRVLFRDLPPLPFSTLQLKLKGGARSPLATPTTCGKYTTEATNTPWSAPESGPPLSSPSAFAVDSGPNGMPCAHLPQDRPFEIGLSSGTDSTQAGAFSPLTFQITRPDGSQELETLELSPPEGLTAKLRGVPYCAEAQIGSAAGRASGRAEESSPSCPAASQVGRTLAGAGSGPEPFYAPGRLYLAGPYKGAPLSVVAITPAVAGPFDLGNVVVRSAVHVDPVTARVTAKTDPLPQIVAGVPLRIRDVRVILDRPGFSLNPSGCEEKRIDGRATGANGAGTQLANRFQVGNCGALGFKPKTRLRLFGGIKRGSYQGVKAVVRPRLGDANISRTVVRFPRSAFVAQENIRTICTRVQFAADACPKGSIYGRAIAYSPLLDEPLRGNVYLRSSDNELPDAVADLRGPAHQPIKVEVAVRNDSVKGALRNTVQAAPDAPVSYFRLQIFGGKKGLIVNSRNICRGRNAAWVGMKAHNGRRSLQRVNVFNKRCKALKRKQRAQRRKAQRSHRSARSGT